MGDSRMGELADLLLKGWGGGGGGGGDAGMHFD